MSTQSEQSKQPEQVEQSTQPKQPEQVEQVKQVEEQVGKKIKVMTDEQMNELWVGKISYYFLETNLKNYKMYCESRELFSPVFSCCDACYSIYPKATLLKPDWFNEQCDETLCAGCYEKLSEDLKHYFTRQEYIRSPGSVLY